MQVHSVDTKTNFKALKISPKLRAEIIKRGGDYITSMDSYGKEIADVKLYNVVFDTSLHTPKIFRDGKNVSKDYFAWLKREERYLGKHYEVPAGVDGDTRSGFYPDEPTVFTKLFGDKSKSKYAEFKKKNILEQAAEYSRLLEELEVKNLVAQEKVKAEQRFKEAEEKDIKIKLEKTLDNLLEKYKYEEPDQNVTSESAIKRLWKRIFG